MYYWRDLNENEREEVRRYRRLGGYPKHSPPHFDSDENLDYLLSASNYEHKKIVGKTPARMSNFRDQLLEILCSYATDIWAWCILPNHYHALLKTHQMKKLREQLGRLHGRTSFEWNTEDTMRGRKVWHNCFERKMRSERHYFATLNYVLNNAVHHGYVEKWEDWPWSNANDYLAKVGHAAAVQIWNDCPVLDYGKKRDID
jgi:putative transposase